MWTAYANQAGQMMGAQTRCVHTDYFVAISMQKLILYLQLKGIKHAGALLLDLQFNCHTLEHPLLTNFNLVHPL